MLAASHNCFSGRGEAGGVEECFTAFILGSGVPQRVLWAPLAAKKDWQPGEQNLFWQRSTARPLEESLARRIGSLRACFGLCKGLAGRRKAPMRCASIACHRCPAEAEVEAAANADA